MLTPPALRKEEKPPPNGEENAAFECDVIADRTANYDGIHDPVVVNEVLYVCPYAGNIMPAFLIRQGRMP